jgi:hypothetical protein
MPDEPKYENDGLLMETRRPYWSNLALVGSGEHVGTHLRLTRDQLYAHKFEGTGQLSALLDRLFLLAHWERTAIATHRAETENTGSVHESAARRASPKPHR